MKRFHVLFASVLVVALMFALAPVTEAKKAAPAPSIVDIVVSNPDIDGDGTGDNADDDNDTTLDTRGCSCSQIVEAAGIGNNHLKRGCSTSAMLNWINTP